MSEKIKPALSPEEWAKLVEGERDGWISETIMAAAEEIALSGLPNPTRHGLAALCVYGQSFGFTREDVKAIRRVLDNSDLCDVGPPGQGWYSPEREADVSRLNDLTARIEALLPPDGA